MRLYSTGISKNQRWDSAQVIQGFSREDLATHQVREATIGNEVLKKAL